MTGPPGPSWTTKAFIALLVQFRSIPVWTKLDRAALSFLIATLSAAVWRLESFRARRQTNAAHREAEPAAVVWSCPRCFAEYGAPANWPKTICPACKRKFLVRPAIDTGR